MLPLFDDQPTKRFPFVTILVILANALVFVGWQLRIGIQQSVDIGGLIPVEFAHAPYTWSLMHMVSAMFMHAGWMHLVGNMWFLWIFGNNVEDSMGRPRFIVFYLLGGIAATALQLAIDPGSTVPNIGASGAIAGVLGGYILLFPRARVITLILIVFFFTFVELPAMVLLGFWFLQQALFGYFDLMGSSGEGGVAYFAHIGGFAFGLAAIRLFADERKTRAQVAAGS